MRKRTIPFSAFIIGLLPGPALPAQSKITLKGGTSVLLQPDDFIEVACEGSAVTAQTVSGCSCVLVMYMKGPAANAMITTLNKATGTTTEAFLRSFNAPPQMESCQAFIAQDALCQKLP